jgi:hypothetical protein
MALLLHRPGAEATLPASVVSVSERSRMRYRVSCSGIVRLPDEMRVVWAVPCATISGRADGGYDGELVGLTDCVVDELPAPVQFMIMFRLGAQRDAIPETCRMTFEVIDSAGEIVFSRGGPATIQNPSPILEEDEVYSDSPMPFAFSARRPGLHRLLISIDGETAAEIPLRVVLTG